MTLSSFRLMDVTLRDGGHINQFHFSQDFTNMLITALDAAQVDFIEVGYRNGSISPIDNIGVAGLCPDSYLQQCAKLLTNAKLAVMAHSKNITMCDIQALIDNGVHLLRLCIEKGQHALATSIIEKANQLQLNVSANLIHISQYTKQEMINALNSLEKCHPSMIYFADSNGCMQPEEVSLLFKTACLRSTIPLGFHAHDNIGLAQTNAIAALQAGAQYIDASLAGMGKGIGNLRTEFFVAYCHNLKQTKYLLEPLRKASNTLRQTILQDFQVPQGEFLRGIFDLSTQQMQDYLVKGTLS